MPPPPAPAAPEAPPAKITPPASVGQAVPPSGGSINVSQMPKGDPTVQPPKPGSAKSRMFDDLKKKANLPPDKPSPSPADGRSVPPTGDGDPTPSPSTAEPGEETPPAAADAPAEPQAGATDKGKKQSPWKLVDQFKERAAKAEARALELEKLVVPEAQRKETTTRLETLEKQNTELRNELRYHNAEKYDPDIINLNKQYESGWKRALSELAEIAVKDPTTGEQRVATADDLMALVNSPLGQARTIADEMFGPFADDVMAHRKEIRSLFDQKSAKMEELKTTAGDREKQRQEQFQNQTTALQTEIKTVWEKTVNDSLADTKHSHYFKQKEGDEEWNGRLERGFKMVDEAFELNPFNPKIPPQQRAEIIRRSVAVRNRAASWGPLRYAYEQLQKTLEATTKELESYKNSSPPAGGRTSPAAPASNGSAKERMWDALGKLVKPG